MSSPTSFKGLQASIYAQSTASSSSASTTSSASFALTTPTPAPTPPSSAKAKAYYRIIRLDKHEIERRNGAGHCTYCNETDHSRRSCAAGRIMRKVPKRVLDARLRSGVCPLCGDPGDDGHCKLSCPQKQTLQAVLNAKREDSKNTAATDSASASSTDNEDDLIDFGDTTNASPTPIRIAASSTTLCCLPSSTFPTSFKQKYTRHKQKQNHNLLDTDATETVWGGMTLPMAKVGLGLGFDMDMDVDAEYNPTEDLIEI